MRRPLPHRNDSYLLILVLATACFLIPTALADAATYYVATDGDNLNPGTIELPWADLYKPREVVGPGDTIFLRGGTYSPELDRAWSFHHVSGTAALPITLRNYPGEHVVFDNKVGEDYMTRTILETRSHYVVQGFEFVHNDVYGIAAADAQNVVIRNCVFHDGNPAIAGDFIKFQRSHNMLVEHCEFYGVCAGNALDTTHSQVEFRYNYIHDWVPVISGQATTIYNKGESYDSKFHHNVWKNCPAPGTSGWANYSGYTVVLGESVGAGNPDTYDCNRPEFYNNIIYGSDWWAVCMWDCVDAKIYNNTFVVEDTQSSWTRGVILVRSNSHNTTIKNNIMISRRPGWAVFICMANDTSDQGFVSDNNLFYATAGTPCFAWKPLIAKYPHQDPLPITLEEWQAISGQDEHSTVADPLFLSLPGNDFHLTQDSPAIDAGVYELGVPSDDFDGNPRPYGDAIDIGAYEYTGAGGGNEAPVLAWAGESGYESDGLDPETGTAATDFTWKIEYSDPDDDAPYGVYLHVLEDGTELGDSPHDMTAEESGDWSAGVVFAKALTLPKGNDYTYYFSAADEHGAQTSYPATPLAGPQVNNSPPSTPTVTISPESPTDQDELQATAEGSIDIDEGDEISYQYQWYCDDVLQEDLTEATVLATRTSVGEAWGCEVVATDGQDDSEAGSAEVTVTTAYSISGTMLGTDGNPVADVNVTAGGDSATTAADGTYTIQGLPAGTYTVTPSLAEYGFDPGSQEVTVNETQGDASAVDFTASQEIYSISGIVTSGGSGLQGVQVAANGHSTATAADGRYTIQGLIAGTYTVTPALAGYGFAPESAEISVGSGEGSATGVDFVGGSIFTLTVPAGLSLIGVPCTPLGDSSPGSLFGDAPVVVRWDPIALQYVASDPGAGPTTEEFLAVAPSKGYFVYMSEAQELRIAGEPAGTATPFAGVALSPGWNMVANPFNEELPFANFLTHTTNIRPYGFAYDWEANSYRVVIAEAGISGVGTSLLPGEGIWVCAVESGTLIVEPPMGTSAQAAQQQEEPQHDGWTIPIVARAAGCADLSSLAGVTGTEVSWQVYNPPSVPDSVDVYFVSTGDRRLAHDLRPGISGSFSWDFVVSTDIRDAEVAVSLPDLSRVPADLSLILEDRDVSRAMYARTMTSYMFRSNNDGPTERHFRLSVAPPNDRGLVISTASAHAAGSVVRLAYSVSRPCSVSIIVLNIAGRLIDRLCTDRVVSEGTNMHTWDLRSQGGSRVPGGFYLVSIEAKAENGQRVRSIVPATVMLR